MYGKAKQSQKAAKRVRGKVYSARTIPTLVSWFEEALREVERENTRDQTSQGVCESCVSS